MISESQRRKFFPLEHRAWLTHAARLGLASGDRAVEDAWYRNELLAVCGVDTVKSVHPVDDFDRIMLHWAQICGDDREIAYWATAAERRLKRRIRLAMQELADVEGRTITWEYVRAIQFRMSIPESLDDCPVELLRKVFQALDTHVRRLKRRESVKEEVPF